MIIIVLNTECCTLFSVSLRRLTSAININFCHFFTLFRHHCGGGLPKNHLVSISHLSDGHTVIHLRFWITRFEETRIRLVQDDQSDQGLHCLPFGLHIFKTTFVRY